MMTARAAPSAAMAASPAVRSRATITRASDAGMGIIVRGGVARGAPEDWEHRSYYMVPTETMRDPRYPLSLLLRVITVSLETQKLVGSLPALDILDEPATLTRSVAARAALVDGGQ